MTFSSTVKLDIPLIKRRILELDLKKTWIAAKIGVTKSAFFDWLNGKVKRVKYANAKALAEILELSLEEITAERHLPDQPQAFELSEYGRRKSSLNSVMDYINIYLADLPAKHSLIHLISVREYLKAEELIQETVAELKESPPAADTHLAAGHLNFLAFEYVKALRNYDRVLVNDKSHVSIILRVGYLKGLLGYFDEARNFLNLHEQLLEERKIKDLIVADILFEQGMYDKGLELLNPWIASLESEREFCPKDCYAQLIQARSYLSSSQIKEFHGLMAQIEVNSNDPHTHGFAVYLKGLEAIVAGRSEEAHKLLDQILEFYHNGAHPVDIKCAAKTRMLIAWLHFHRKDHCKALSHSIEAGDILKDHFKAHHFLHFEIEQVRIESLIALRKLAEAKKRFEFFEQVGHNSFSHDHVKKSLTNLIKGKILQAEHEYTAAIACYDAARNQLKQDKQRQYIYGFVIQAHIAGCYTHLGRYDEAEKLYQGLLPDPRVDKTFSLFQTYFIAYAGMLAKRGDVKESLHLARTLYRRNIGGNFGDGLEILLHYGKLWLNNGKPKKAMIFFEKAAKINNQSYDTQTVPFYIGLCHLLQRNFDKARDCFHRVEANFGKAQNLEPRLYLNISYMTGLIDTYQKAPRQALERFDHILESRYREQFDAVCFHHAYVYFFMGINNILLQDRIDSQFYLKRFVHASSREAELLSADVDYSKYLLSNLDNQLPLSIEDSPFLSGQPCIKGYIHLDKALV